jgi:anti-sigma regulatory factor (Ser/Thr protein kinase)
VTAATGGGHDQRPADTMITAKLTADASPAREARAAVRRAITAWGMDALSEDAELLASELVANAAEHAGGNSISFALRRQADRNGDPGITCEVSDTSPVLPQIHDAAPDAERGRGLAIVAALASASGVRASPAGKTSWFSLAVRDRAARIIAQAEAEHEAEA